MKYVIIVNGGDWNDIALAIDFAALVRYLAAQQDTHVVGLASFDLGLTTAVYNSLLFDRGNLGPDGREHVLRRGEILPQSVRSESRQLKDSFPERIKEQVEMFRTGDSFLT